MTKPIKNGKITFGFHAPLNNGSLHQGVDFAVPVGTPVYAAADGKLLLANWGSYYGTHIVIYHPGFGYAVYAHLSKKNVSWFARFLKLGVKEGQLIGWSGATGNVTGPHLHFEIQGHKMWVHNAGNSPAPILFA
jgi:murein DD-endopeptidase MepM/ murein hydrolase activator NlpD